jgi:hypothetical protein
MRNTVENADYDDENRRRIVCKSCHVVMDDLEPFAGVPEFYHPLKYKDGTKSKCDYAGKYFRGDEKQVEPFRRKRFRRILKRTSKR